MPKTDPLPKNESNAPLPDALNYTTALHSSASALLLNTVANSKPIDVYQTSHEVVFNPHMPVSSLYPHVQVGFTVSISI